MIDFVYETKELCMVHNCTYAVSMFLTDGSGLT